MIRVDLHLYSLATSDILELSVDFLKLWSDVTGFCPALFHQLDVLRWRRLLADGRATQRRRLAYLANDLCNKRGNELKYCFQLLE